MPEEMDPQQPQARHANASDVDVSQESWKENFAKLPEISFEEALHLLKNGQPLVGKKIPFLYLDYLAFEQEVKFENCLVGGFVARGTHFSNLSICHCLFVERLEMSAKKRDDGEFRKSVVTGEVDIRDSRFCESLTLRNADVSGNFAVNNCHVDGTVVFDKACFNGHVHLFHMPRMAVLSAYRAQFAQNLTLEHCHLPGQQDKALDLNGARIGGTLLMVECQLAQEMQMKRADIGGERQAWQMNSCQINGIDISESFFHGEVAFTQVTCNGPFLADIPKEVHGQKAGRSTVFERDVAFLETTFAERCSFHAAFFKGYANFKKCKFSKGGNFKQVDFQQLCSFWESEADEKLQFDKARFMGRANFGKVAFAPKSSFNEAVFDGEAQFHEAKAKGDIFFGSAQFHDRLTLRGAEFLGGVSLTKISVEKAFNIANCTISDRLILSESEFNGPIIAPALSVGTWASMASCVVRGRIDMAGLKIGSHLPEQQAEKESGDGNTGDSSEQADKKADQVTGKTGKQEEIVPGTFYLDNAVFYQDVDMSYAFVRGNLCLDYIKTHAEVDLSNSRICRNLILSHSYFRGTLRCDSVNCDELLSSTARYKEEASFNGLRCNKVSLRYSSFDGGFTMRSASVVEAINMNNADVDGKADFFKCECPNIFFQNFLADYFLISRHLLGDALSSERARNYRQAKNEYGILKQAFQTQNHYKEMDWAYYRFCRANRKSKKAEWKHPLRSLGVFFDWLFLDIGFGYGTRPMNIGLVAFIVILSFAGAFYCFPQGIVDASGQPSLRIQFLDAVYLSLNSFTCMDYGNCGPAFGHWLKYLFSIEGLLGIFLTTLFVATVSRKIIRT